MSEEVVNESAPGWDAIDAALRPIYGEQKPAHYGTSRPFALGGPDPLDGISIYKSDVTQAHWHFVTYGMSELYFKDSPILEQSGWGFEFTFRVQRTDDEPPLWVLSFLQNLARYVMVKRAPFDVGHRKSAAGPICLDSGTELGAITFILDPELGEIETPHGHLKFLQIVAITEAELAAMRATTTEGILELLALDNPWHVTDLARESVVEISETPVTVQAAEPKKGWLGRFKK